MDNRQLKQANERAEDLRKQIAARERRRRETESALTRENDAHLKATAERATLVEELAGADDATAGWAHREIDRLDSALRHSSRVSEGLSSSLSRMAREIVGLNAELTEATRIIEQEKREKGLTEFRSQLQQATRDAEEALGNTRAALAALNLTAARGAELFGLEAETYATQLVSEFRNQQVNPELLGWRELRGVKLANLQFTVRPMTRSEAAR